MVEHGTENAGVGGSSPPLGTIADKDPPFPIGTGGFSWPEPGNITDSLPNAWKSQCESVVAEHRLNESCRSDYGIDILAGVPMGQKIAPTR